MTITFKYIFLPNCAMQREVVCLAVHVTVYVCVYVCNSELILQTILYVRLSKEFCKIWIPTDIQIKYWTCFFVSSYIVLFIFFIRNIQNVFFQTKIKVSKCMWTCYHPNTKSHTLYITIFNNTTIYMYICNYIHILYIIVKYI